MSARTGAINAITFSYYLNAYRSLMTIPNVRIFARRAKAFRRFVRRLSKRAEAAELDVAIAVGKCLATIAYAQLIAENSTLLAVPPPIVSTVFHLLMIDLSGLALTLASSAKLDGISRTLIRRVVGVPKATAEEWEFVHQQMACSFVIARDGRSTLMQAIAGHLQRIDLMLIEHLFTHGGGQPGDLAIVDDRGSYTYEQLAGMAKAMGALIRSQTKKPQVGLLLPAGAGFVAAFYGAWLAGKTAVPLNYLLGDREIAHCIADSGIDTVITVPQLAARLKGMPLKVIDQTQLPSPPQMSQTDGDSLPSPAANEVAMLMYTSGTSGLPKGVPLTFGNLQHSVNASIAHAAFQSRHKFLDLIPLFHVFGVVAGILAPIQLGATVIYMARFSPVGALKAIREHGVSLVLGVPSMYAALLRLKDASPGDFKTIYAMISGGEPLPSNLRESFLSRFGVMLFEAYGMTETSLGIALNTPQSHKPGSVGTPVPGMQIRIADDAGNPLGTGEEGEIWVKGPMVMEHYHNLPEETAAALTVNHFFKTGDLGKLDADGFLFITGRKKDLIIVAGEKASPREIEEVLTAHPAVSEAAVIGRKDPTRGEAIVAFIVAREGQSPNSDELREFCRQHGLPSWKVPREVRIVPELPRSPTGKVLKQLLAGAGITN